MVCENLSDEVAAGYQYDENKSRHDVSAYSEALLYRRMLDDGLLCSEAELAKQLNLPRSSINDLLSFTKIPSDIINKISNMNKLSKNMAVKISRIVNANPENYEVMLSLAPEMGAQLHRHKNLKSTLVTRSPL